MRPTITPADVPAFAEESVTKMTEVGGEAVTKLPVSDAELACDGLKLIEKLYENKSRVTRLETGLSHFDQLTAGLPPADLIVLAARPGMGKSALALEMGLYAAQHDKVVVFFSLEMSKEQLQLRLLSLESKVEHERLKTGYLRTENWQPLMGAHDRIRTATARTFWLEDSSELSVMDMRAISRRIRREQGRLDLVVVDYLQIVRPAVANRFSREQEVASISTALKAMAKALKVPVLVLAQLNRQVEARQDRRPTLADLRESGAIEQDPDVIAFIYRDELYNPHTKEPGIAEVAVKKHRNGRTAMVKFVWQGKIMRFDTPAQAGGPVELVEEPEWSADDDSPGHDDQGGYRNGQG